MVNEETNSRLLFMVGIPLWLDIGHEVPCSYIVWGRPSLSHLLKPLHANKSLGMKWDGSESPHQF